MSKPTILYSHGFGVRKDSRGLFTDIAEALPDYRHDMFDYCTEHPDDPGSIVIPPLSQQAERFKKQLALQPPDTDITIIAHSQGCVVACMADVPANVRRIILLAPPMSLSADRITSLFGAREGSVINKDGLSKLARSDGTYTYLEPAYWAELSRTNPVDLFNRVAQQTQVDLVIAEHDDVLPVTAIRSDDVDPRITTYSVQADHNFTGDARADLITLLASMLQSPASRL